MTCQRTHSQRCSLRKLFSASLWTATIATAATCFTASVSTAQDSVRDRLSPGNGPDWAGEPFAETSGYTGGDSQNQPQAGDAVTQPGAQPGIDQPWYRGNDGRFFYRDQAGKSIYEDQVYGPRSATRAGAQRQAQAQEQNANTNQRRPALGIALSDTPSGVQVSAVQPGSAAEQAGIRAGDIINRVNDQDATSSQDFVNRVGQMKAGDTFAMDYTRNGQPQRLTATLGSATVQDNLYRSARPTWSDNELNRSSMDLDQFRRDFDTLRGQVDALSKRFDTFSEGSAAKQIAD